MSYNTQMETVKATDKTTTRLHFHSYLSTSEE